MTICILFLLFFIFRNSKVLKMDFKRDSRVKKKYLRNRILLFISRSVIIILLFIALAAPYTQTVKEVQGNPRVTLLLDNSSSMDVFDLSFVSKLQGDLEDNIPTRTKIIAHDLYSEIGDVMLENLRSNENILMISDGNTNYREYGSEISDVALFANQINASIGAITLNEIKQDAAVSSIGPETVTAGIDSFFTVLVYKTRSAEYKLNIELDGVAVSKDDISILSQSDYVDMYELKLVVERGNHILKSQIVNDDYNKVNNLFLKSIKGVQKQDILVVTKKSDPLVSVLRTQYAVTAVDSLPADLTKYYAVIINDIPASSLDSSLLTSYVNDGNGVFFIGGFNSFDRGKYKSSAIEQLLPVQVGKGSVSRGVSSIMLALDISGSLGNSKTVDMEKLEFVKNLEVIYKWYLMVSLV